MENLNETTLGMTPQEKDKYFKHMEKRHAEEKEYVEAEKNRLRIYKQGLVEDILKNNSRYTRDELIKMSIRRLESIHDYL